MTDGNGIDKSSPEGRELLLNFAEFQAASSDFSDNATELMAASVRVQILILDDARMTMTKIADSLSVAARKRRASDLTHG